MQMAKTVVPLLLPAEFKPRIPQTVFVFHIWHDAAAAAAAITAVDIDAAAAAGFMGLLKICL